MTIFRSDLKDALYLHNGEIRDLITERDELLALKFYPFKAKRLREIQQTLKECYKERTEIEKKLHCNLF